MAIMMLGIVVSMATITIGAIFVVEVVGAIAALREMGTSLPLMAIDVLPCVSIMGRTIRVCCSMAAQLPVLQSKDLTLMVEHVFLNVLSQEQGTISANTTMQVDTTTVASSQWIRQLIAPLNIFQE